jgi:hypothetical protein
MRHGSQRNKSIRPKACAHVPSPRGGGERELAHRERQPPPLWQVAETSIHMHQSAERLPSNRVTSRNQTPGTLRGTPRNSEELRGTRGTPRNSEEPEEPAEPEELRGTRGTPRNSEEPEELRGTRGTRGTPRNPRNSEELLSTTRGSAQWRGLTRGGMLRCGGVGGRCPFRRALRCRSGGRWRSWGG